MSFSVVGCYLTLYLSFSFVICCFSLILYTAALRPFTIRSSNNHHQMNRETSTESVRVNLLVNAAAMLTQFQNNTLYFLWKSWSLGFTVTRATQQKLPCYSDIFFMSY